MKVTFEKVDELIHKPERHKLAQTETLSQHIERLTYRLDIAHLIIHDIISCDRYFCDQGCKVGSGCKKDYTPNNHSLMMIATVIKVPEDYGTIISDTEATEYQIEMLSRLRVKFPDLEINVGRGDRLMVNGKVIKGFLFYDVRNRKDYDADEAVFTEEITTQIV